MLYLNHLHGFQAMSDDPVNAGGLGWCVWELTNLDRLSKASDWYDEEF